MRCAHFKDIKVKVQLVPYIGHEHCSPNWPRSRNNQPVDYVMTWLTLLMPRLQMCILYLLTYLLMLYLNHDLNSGVEVRRRKVS